MVLFLNDVAGSEIVLILFFILIFFGAKSIPGLAQTLGKTIRQVKDASAELQSEIKKSSTEMKKDLNLEGIVRETTDTIQRPLDQYADDLDNAVKYSGGRKTHLAETNSLPENLPKKPDSSNEEVEKPTEAENKKTDDSVE